MTNVCQRCWSPLLMRVQKNCLYHYECQYDITLNGEVELKESFLDPAWQIGDTWIDFTFCTVCGQIQGNWSTNNDNPIKENP